jgi:hypothetical protein
MRKSEGQIGNSMRSESRLTAARQELDPQIHAISDETHRKIYALLSTRKNWKGDAATQG